MKPLLPLLFLALLIGCTQQQKLPADVTGELVPINKTQVIDYDH